MGALKKKTTQGILIDGHKYKDGANVLRKSKVTVVPPDGSPKQGIKLGVRIASDQDVVEFKLGQAAIQDLPRDGDSESELDTNDPAGGESWRVWRVPRGLLPPNLKDFKTTFRLSPPKAIQTVKWAVVYANQPFSGGFVIFGHADVGWNGAEKGSGSVERRSGSRKKPRPKKRGGR
jgi:hypothetical protein